MLLASGPVRECEVRAVESAARVFKGYGIGYDIRSADESNLRAVRYSSFVRDVLRRPDAHAINDLRERTFGMFRELVFPRDYIGVGITTQNLFARRHSDMRVDVFGTGVFGSYAFLSTAIIDQDLPTILTSVPKDKLIEAVAKYEISRALMDRNGCWDERCIARPNRNSVERMLDAIDKELDFCGSCKKALARGIRMIKNGVAVVQDWGLDAVGL